MPESHPVPSRRRPGWHWAIAAVLPLLAWSATVGYMSHQPNTYGISVAEGAAKFRDYCGACHIVEKGITTHHGPNLSDIGKLAGSRKPGMSAAAYLLESILDPEAFVAPTNRAGMPKNIARELAPDEIRNMIAFLASQGGTPQYQEIRGLDVPDLRPDLSQPIPVRRDELQLAEEVIRGKGGCLDCHSLFRNAEHQILAPPLFAVGLKDQELVRESIVEPSKVISPAYRAVSVVLASGRVLTGRVISRTGDRLLVASRDSEGRLVREEILLEDVETEDGEPLLVESDVSLMPSGFEQLLTPEELTAVLHLIDQLN